MNNDNDERFAFGWEVHSFGSNWEIHIRRFINTRRIAVEISRQYGDKVYGVYISKNRKVYKCEEGFEFLDDAKSFADEKLVANGVKTIADEYKVLS